MNLTQQQNLIPINSGLQNNGSNDKSKKPKAEFIQVGRKYNNNTPYTNNRSKCTNAKIHKKNVM